MRKTRLFIATKPLNTSISVKIEGNDFDYLAKVMRKKVSDEIYVFNGTDGEWRAEILSIEKRNLTLLLKEKITEQMPASLVTLAFAPVKNVRIDFVAAKATEMGVARFAPIITHHSVVDKINEERFQANIKEACEQCERNDFPQIAPIKKLEKFLAENAQNFNEQNENKNEREKILILCDETHQGRKASELLPEIFAGKFFNKELNQNPNSKNASNITTNLDFNQNFYPEIIILIGPEGGFSKEEFAKMRTIKNLYSMSLGKRILRADTAIIAALALVNEFLPQ